MAAEPGLTCSSARERPLHAPLNERYRCRIRPTRAVCVCVYLADADDRLIRTVIYEIQVCRVKTTLTIPIITLIKIVLVSRSPPLRLVRAREGRRPRVNCLFSCSLLQLLRSVSFPFLMTAEHAQDLNAH